MSMSCKVPYRRSEGNRKLYLWYTLLFLCVSCIAFLPFIFTGKSFVYNVDGGSQYIVYLRYMGQYLRRTIAGLMSGDLTIPMYDHTIGMGDDINAIVRFHPLDFLSVLFPASCTEYLYDAILLIRYYLSGLSFCAFAAYWSKAPSDGPDAAPMGADLVNILSGSMIYVFGGYMLMRVMNHPTYASAFIILPMVLLGAEKVMTRKGMLLFPVSVFLGFVSNYYFMYICSIALLFYVLLRMPDVIRRQRDISFSKGGKSVGAAGCFFGHFLRMSSLYLLGMGMSMAVLLPTMIRYLNSYRTVQTSARQNLLIYSDLRRYGAWLINLITPYVSSGNGTNLNFAITVFPALFMLFLFGKGKLRTLKGALILELVCLLVPAGGYVMAGFNNENNRWMFLIALALGMTVTFLADDFAQMDPARRKVLIGCGVFFALAGAGAALFLKEKIYIVIAAAELAGCIIVLLILDHRHAGIKAVRRTVLAITCISVIIGAWATFLPNMGNTMSECLDAGKAYDRYKNGVGGAADKVGADIPERIDSPFMKAGSENAGIYFGYAGTSMYNSIVNADLLKTLIAEENTGLDSITHLQDLDGRFPTESVSGVRYYLTKVKGDRPYGFSGEPVMESGDYYVYENECVLPMAFGYESVISASDYDKLDPVGKSLVKLHAAVIDDETVSGDCPAEQIRDIPEKLIVEELELPAGQEGMERTEKGYRTKEKRTELTLKYEKKKGYICLLRLCGFESSKRFCYIKVSSGTTRKTFTLRGDKDTYTLGRKNYVVDLMAQSEPDGESESGEICITFVSAADYSLSSAQVIYVPVRDLKEELGKLSEEALENTRVSSNRITGDITLSKDRVVVFRILNQKGWKLYTDGALTELFGANNCYMGAVIPEGTHQIELVYETPGSRPGTGISAAALLIWIVLAFRQFRRRKRVDAA